MKTSVIEVHDMLSVLSVDEVKRRISEVPSVESVTVNFAAGSATVRYDETRLEVADIKSAAPAADSAGDGHEGHAALGAPPASSAPLVTKPSSAADPALAHQGHAEPDGKSAKSTEMAHEMGHRGGKDLSAMVREMRNRFWICLAFSLPIFVYSPMGGMFTPPAPPFGYLFFAITHHAIHHWRADNSWLKQRKVQRSGLWDAVEGRVLIYLHKEQMLKEIESRIPARHYVMVDDKLRILAAMKKIWGERLTTVFPRQGHYAFDSRNTADYTQADITIERIGELVNYNLSVLLGTVDAAQAQQEAP